MQQTAFDTAAFLAHANEVLIGNYARSNVVMVRGEGATLWDSDGKRYLDFFAGFGGAVLGHANPDLVKAVAEQVGQLWHVGNTFHSVPQVEVAERLNKWAFKGQAFFCHSGLEANEAAVKLARLRFIAVLVAIGLVITQWDTLLAYYDRWTRPDSVDLVAGDFDRARFELFETVDAAQHRALARARPADDRNDVTILDAEIDALEDGHGAIGFLQFLNAQRRHFFSPSASHSTTTAGSRRRNTSLPP